MSVAPADADNENSSKTFLTSLVANVALLSIEVGAFIILKARLGRIYSPRTYLPPPEKRATPLPESYWRWVPAVLKDNPEEIIHKNGLDAYMFLRFLKMLIWIFALFTFLTMAVIVPLDSVNLKTLSVHHDLEKISWTNITDLAESHQSARFWGHIAMVYLLTFSVFFLMRKEMLHFVHLRHKFLNSKLHSRKAQARTVLIMNVPEDLSTERDLRVWASFAPGGVDRVWMYHDTKLLNNLFEERLDACKSLETAVIQLQRDATLKWRVKQKEHKIALKHKKKHNKDEEVGHEEEELAKPEEATTDFVNELIPITKQPHHHTGPLGLVGTKVESISYYTDEISRLNSEIEEARKVVGQGKFMGSAFVRCNIQMGASVLAQCVSYHEPGRMIDKWMEAHPDDVVWSNLDDGPLEMAVRKVTSWVATVALIIGWIPPAVFIGGLSNSTQLCQDFKWLAWICKAQDPIPGIITGILPPVLLAIVFAILPLILRALAWFYLFLLIHGFLIVTLSSGLASAVRDIINNPTTTIQTLASRLPGASTFFLTYIVTQGLSGAAGSLAQLIPIALHFFKKFFLGRTPRQAYSVTFLMPAADFGLIMPRMSLLATIGFAYSVLTPFVNVMALVSFIMFYFAWKYLFTQVFDQPDAHETIGLYYPMAMQNLFVGLYIEHFCLACLFFLKSTNDAMKISSIVEGAFMIFLMVLTAFFHVYLKNQFDPITNYLPMSMATKKMAKRYAKNHSQRAGNLDDIDLFTKSRFRHAKKQIKLLPKALDNTLDTIKSKVIGDEGKKSMDKTSMKKDSMEMTLLKQENVSPTAATSAVAAAPPIEGAPELFRPPSVQSHTSARSASSKVSKRSNASKASKESKRKSHPVFDPPAPALSDTDDSSEDEGQSDDEHAFDHPATFKDQPYIWLPEDILGISKLIIRDLEKAGVHASDLGSTMSHKGVVEVTRGAPDEDWSGGHDR